MKKICSAVLALLVVGQVWAISISVFGSWIETIDISDLQGSPGTDLISSYESAASQIEIDIGGTWFARWRVDVKRVDTNWHGDFHLSVKRTSNGSGPFWGFISGGETYLEATSVDQGFFSGRSYRNNIYVQIKLDGVSVQVPPGTYSTTVYYTVVTT